MTDICCEFMRSVSVLKDLLMSHALAIPFHYDSQSAIYIASNTVYDERTKYIEIDCYLVREQFDKGFLITTHISSSNQPVDMFTKAIGADLLQKLSSKLNVYNYFQPVNLNVDVKHNTVTYFI